MEKGGGTWRFLSTSLRTSLLAPRNKMVQAFGSLQSSMNEKYLDSRER